ncbi:MAG TPA: DUF2249 domain-containing protein [Ktedonobacterales bacterium]
MTQGDDQAATWIATAATTLDVRPTLEQGGEPFVEIMEAAAGIGPGESLVIIAPFEPAPLYGALGSRGFTHLTQSRAADEWVVRFTRAN